MNGWKLTLPVLIAVTSFVALPQGNAQTGTGNNTVTAKELSGAEMCRTYCASCHGIDGKDSGPVAPWLKKAPPDLTQIAKRHNGQFPPDFRIMRIIDGYDIEAVHGSRDMPIWGNYFRGKQRDEGIVSLREHNLTEYLKSIQQR